MIARTVAAAGRLLLSFMRYVPLTRSRDFAAIGLNGLFGTQEVPSWIISVALSLDATTS
jgi:hypothetical protein